MSGATDRAEYNLRQLRLADDAIRKYSESGRSLADLRRLVGALDALDAAMELPDERWAKHFGDAVFGLEQIYAVRVDRGGDLDAHDVEIVAETIDRLLELVGAAIAANEGRSH